MKKYWTEQEIAYLRDHIGNTKISTIAKKLERSETAVILKMKRLGIANTKEHTGLMTSGELAKILDVDRATIRGWIERHGLPIKKRVPRIEKTFSFVDNEEFWSWARKHKDKVDFSKIERNSIPPEPEWVDSLRFDNKQYQKKAYKQWTTKEDMRLRELQNKGMTKREIAKELGRSVISVERRSTRLTNERNANLLNTRRKSR